MSKNSIKTWGGQLYETPAVDVVELEVEQPIFEGSLTFGGPNNPGAPVGPDIPGGSF